jgi:hypothetical protein
MPKVRFHLPSNNRWDVLRDFKPVYRRTSKGLASKNWQSNRVAAEFFSSLAKIFRRPSTLTGAIGLAQKLNKLFIYPAALVPGYRLSLFIGAIGPMKLLAVRITPTNQHF